MQFRTIDALAIGIAWQARGEYEQQRVRKLVAAAQAVIASASYMQQMTESGRVYGSPEMSVPIFDMEKLRQALSEYMGESK